MEPKGDLQHLEFLIPSRGLIGLRNHILTTTSGTAIMTHRFTAFKRHIGEIETRTKGSLTSSEQGPATAFALNRLQDRGRFFVASSDVIYKGQVVGEHNRDNDLEVNFLKGKKLTNMRASGSDENVVLTPPRQMSLEEKMAYINDDEVLEVTPKHLRLRKKYLDHHERKRMSKNNSQNI